MLVTTKHREARDVLAPLLDAAAALPDVHVAIKAHPAETPEVYAALVAGRPHVTVLPAAATLAPLLAASRAVVTVNSTVALDAAVLGHSGARHRAAEQPEPLRRGRDHGGRGRDATRRSCRPSANPV